MYLGRVTLGRISGTSFGVSESASSNSSSEASLSAPFRASEKSSTMLGASSNTLEKPFKTIDEQVAILESRGLTTDGLTGNILQREGYYAVVNGYKDPFLDPWETGMACDDRFIKGASFADLYALFVFDRCLRSVSLRYFAIAEATLKTVCSYCFTQNYPNELNPYLNEAYYSQLPDDRVNVLALIGEFKKTLGINDAKHRYKRNYLKHYVENHNGEVPLWVLMNYLMFGQAFKFYSFQSQSMKNKVAKSFSQLYTQTHDEAKRINPERLRLAYDHIKDFRNICAHDERFYCARVSKAEDITVKDLCADLELVLTKCDHADLLSGIYNLVSAVEAQVGVSVEVAVSMGWKSLGELAHAAGVDALS